MRIAVTYPCHAALPGPLHGRGAYRLLGLAGLPGPKKLQHCSRMEGRNIEEYDRLKHQESGSCSQKWRVGTTPRRTFKSVFPARTGLARLPGPKKRIKLQRWRAWPLKSTTTPWDTHGGFPARVAGPAGLPGPKNGNPATRARLIFWGKN